MNIVNQARPIRLMGNLDPALIGVAAPTIHPATLRPEGSVPVDSALPLVRYGFPQVRGEAQWPGARPSVAIAGGMDKNVLKEIVAASNSRY